MLIVSISYFKGEIDIIINDLNGKDAEKLNTIIEQHEPTILIELLGEMYGDFITNINDTKYQELINGANFTVNGVSIPFVGLKYVVAYRIYYIFKRSENSMSTTIGELQTSNVDTKGVSVDDKTIEQWNRYVDLVGTYSGTYTPSLHNFLTNGDYDNWCIDYPKYKNSFGL